MKKFLVLAVIAGGALTIASCKKDWTCTCTVTTSGIVNSTTTTDTVYQDMTKADAETACTANNGSASAFGQSVSTDCSLN